MDGQLVQLVSEAGAAEKLLYAHVSGATTHNGQSLAVTFAETKGTYGTFAFQGDAVTWTGSNVTRPNWSAWYVCENQALFVNLGNYLYNTPSGCADETVSETPFLLPHPKKRPCMLTRADSLLQ